jgi:prepilin-type N-terminal cleavage/methylation domain-containing protein
MKLFTLEKGFTLIEIIVSMAIFSVVMVVALGAFLKIVDVNKRAQTVEAAVNNLTFTIESMTRELRTGKSYELNPGKNQVTFIAKYTTGSPPVPIYYAYRLSSSKIQRAIGPSAGTKPGSSDFAEATAPNVKVTDLSFELDHTGNIPLIRIFATGEVGSVEKAKTTFSVQTAVSQRLKD